MSIDNGKSIEEIRGMLNEKLSEDLDEVIELLGDYISSNSSNFDEYINIRSSYYRLRTDKINGTLSSEDQFVFTNKISKNIQTLISILEVSDFEKQTKENNLKKHNSDSIFRKRWGDLKTFKETIEDCLVMFNFFHQQNYGGYNDLGHLEILHEVERTETNIKMYGPFIKISYQDTIYKEYEKKELLSSTTYGEVHVEEVQFLINVLDIKEYSDIVEHQDINDKNLYTFSIFCRASNPTIDKRVVFKDPKNDYNSIDKIKPGDLKTTSIVNEYVGQLDITSFDGDFLALFKSIFNKYSKLCNLLYLY